MLRSREEILREVSNYAERVIVVDQKGSITNEQAEEIVDTIAYKVSGMNAQLESVSIETVKEDLLELIAKRKVDITTYWQKDRPLTTPMKGILNSIKQKYALVFNIEDILTYLGNAYPVVGSYTFYICPLQIFGNIAVNGADSNSCFRYYRANYRHYDFLLSIQQIGDAEAKYLLIDNGNKLARAWLIAVEDIALVFNVYSDVMKLDNIKYPTAKAMSLYKDWNGSKFAYDSSAHLPMYTNSGVLVIYNKERIANSKIAIDRIKEARGKCTDCGAPIEIKCANSEDGHIFCDDCNEDSRYTCVGCESRIYDDEVHWYGDEPYCENCFYDFAFYCYHCGEATHIDYGYRGTNNRLYCEDCFEEYYAYCDICGEPELRDNIVEVDDEYYCSYCADEYLVNCDECGEYMKEEVAIKIDGEYYCKECVNSNFIECDVCGEYAHKDDIEQLGDMKLCPDCSGDYDICAKCGKVFPVDDMDYYEDTGYLCSECDRQIDLITEEVA